MIQVDRPESIREERSSTPAVRLTIRPISKTAARRFVNEHHRHNEAPIAPQVQYAIGVYAGDELVGVLTAGRPVARALCDGYTLEIGRVCVIEGTTSGNSKLYGAMCRAAKALGYRKVITYTLHDESGSSLKAAGFTRIADIGARSWAESSVARPRYDETLLGPRKNAANLPKWRWERVL